MYNVFAVTHRSLNINAGLLRPQLYLGSYYTSLFYVDMLLIFRRLNAAVTNFIKYKKLPVSCGPF